MNFAVGLALAAAPVLLRVLRIVARLSSGLFHWPGL